MIAFANDVLFSERMFGKNWREVRLVLHEDSTLAWYLSDSDQEGGILLKDSPEMIAAGQVRRYCKRNGNNAMGSYNATSRIIRLFTLQFQYASHVPGRPDFPEGPVGDIRNTLAIGSRTKPTVQWFLFRSEENLV